MASPGEAAAALAARPGVVVFSRTTCGHSRRAKEALARVVPAERLTVVELDQRPDGEEIKAHLAAKTGTPPTVPKVFAGGGYLGDSSKVVGLAEAGRLEPELRARGAL